ncbi:ATP-binding protein [Natrinema sp. H-ect4]|uniref:ATP-binding protein n=1 Tax=Natrinema sp. H-ect4 TaxID=3242699 RepID=UPI0035A835E6
MTEKVRMPADLGQVTLKLLGKFDSRDLARFGLPTSIAFLYIYTASNPSITAYAVFAASTVFGSTWAIWRPWGRPLDQNLYQALRWTTQKEIDVTPEVEQGLIKAGDSVTALIEVEPINLELKSGSEKAALHKLYQDLLQTVDYQVTVYSTQSPIDLKTHLNELDTSDKVQESYSDYCHRLQEAGQNKTTHYVSVRVEDGDIEELENRVDEIQEQLNSGGLTTNRVSQFEGNEVKPTPEVNHNNLTYPDSENRTSSKTVCVSEYPGDVDFSWITQLLQVEGLVDVTQVVNPREAADTVSSLQKLENKAEAENDSLVRKGYGSSRRLERLLDDVDWFQNLLADQDDQPVEYGVYITVYGENDEACEATLRQVQNRLKTLGIKYRNTALRTDQSHYTTMPGLPDKLDEGLLVPAGSAASGFPFTSTSSIDENGVLFGVGNSTDASIILDRFKWNAGHQVLAGATGSGKSFYSKLLLLRSSLIYDNLQINIVDPKPEYGEIEKVLRNYASVNRFEFKGSVSDDAQELIQHVEEAYHSAQQTSAKTIVVVDEAHRLLKTEQGASVLSTLVREARSSNTAATLITQTINDFYRTEDGEDILKNIPCKALFAHEEADNRPAEAFNLSTVAETSLYNLAKGDQDSTDYSQAILSVSNQFESEIKVEASDVEASIIEKGEIADNISPAYSDFEKDHNGEHSFSEISEEAQNAEEDTNSIIESLSRIDLPALSWPSLSSNSDNATPSEPLKNDSNSNDTTAETSFGIPNWIKGLAIAGGLFLGITFVIALAAVSSDNLVESNSIFGVIAKLILTFSISTLLLYFCFSLVDAYNAVKEA